MSFATNIEQVSNSRKGLLIISKKKPIFANQNASPANQRKKTAKKSANQKSGCSKFYPVMRSKIEYLLLHRAFIRHHFVGRIDALFLFQPTQRQEGYLMDYGSLQERQFMPEMFMDQLKDYDMVKPHLLMEIVGKEANAEKLQSVPHTDMEDMAVTYRILMDRSEDGQATIPITNKLIDHYGITVEQLHEDAIACSEKIAPLSILNMNELMYEMSGGLFGGPDDPPSPIYVATNESRLQGASVIAYPDFMDQAAEKLGGSFFILPSSVHEVILVPDSIELSISELKAMVTQVNASEVLPKDRLTDNVYHFDAEARIFEKASQFEQRIEKSKERRSVLDELGSKKQTCLEKPVKEHSPVKRDAEAR